VWIQDYDPMGNWMISTMVSALPVLILLGLLATGRASAWKAALAGLVTASLVALLVFRMPVSMVVSSVAVGVAFALFRIVWLIVAAVFLYDITVETGQFEIMKASIARLSADRRLQVVLVAFCFGALIEGAAGFGAPVAISAAFLVGLGFPPFQAALLCLIANTAPVAWGGVGNPIRVLAGVTALPEPALSAMTGRILPPLSAILPFWLVRTMVGWRETFEVWPALAVSGLSFAGMQFYWSNYQESGLVDIIAALFSLLTMVAFLKLWKPKTIRENPTEPGEPINTRVDTIRRHSIGTVLKGWSPFLLASLFIFVWAQPKIARYLTLDGLKQPMPGLHQMVVRVPPVVPEPTPEGAIADLNILSLPGTAVLLGAVLAALVLGMSPARIARIFASTVVSLMPSLLAISFMVGLAYVTKYAGMDTVLGLSLTRTGPAFPFFGTLLGWLGVALTGTDAGSNALFGNLQKVTAERLGISPILMASANSSGGVMGKMIDAQSIVVSSTATRQVGREAAIFQFVFKHSIALACLVGAIVMLYAFAFPGVIPAATPAK
jgi:lactate permease